MNLAHLSMSRFRQVNGKKQNHPHVPTNQDRLRALRGALVPSVGSTYPWPHLDARRNAGAAP